jgi:hypothetical protein
MIPVVKLPNCGSPDDSSNTEPTAAIAATQDPANNTPLFGVTPISPRKMQFSVLQVEFPAVRLPALET